jgi:hypothetical protein
MKGRSNHSKGRHFGLFAVSKGFASFFAIGGSALHKPEMSEPLEAFAPFSDETGRLHKKDRLLNGTTYIQGRIPSFSAPRGLSGAADSVSREGNSQQPVWLRSLGQ